ncbi:MAG: hypothetical protein LBG74_03505 [Spirochaetaceae bacterium]|jgi:hypothetical protein|nr:hypothetical protein [Spirochaetaceae bacterium]
MKIRLLVFCAFLVLAACDDIKLPKLHKDDVEANFYLTLPSIVEPKTLFSSSSQYTQAEVFTVKVNPQGLSINTVQRDDGSFLVKLRGVVTSGIPMDLRLFNHPNPQYESSAQTPNEPRYYRYGDYLVQTYPIREYDVPDGVIDPNYSPKYLDTSANNTRIAGKKIRYSAVTLTGMLQEKDKKGNTRDLTKGIVITQKNDALNLYSNVRNALAGGGSDWTYYIDLQKSPPVMTTNYTNLHPYMFPATADNTANSKQITRGGISFLIWEGASSKTVEFTITYKDNGTTKVVVDYTEVSFTDIQPSTFWFYSNYTPNLSNGGEDLPFILSASGNLASSLTNASDALLDPDGSLITGRILLPPKYIATGSPPGPFPYFFPQNARRGPPAKTGASEVYDNDGDKLGSGGRTITLLPVFYPDDTSNRAVEWSYGDRDTDSYSVSDNADGSITIMRKTASPPAAGSGAGNMDVTATVYIPDKNSPTATMNLKAKIYWEANP